jgi:large subunit ribosomal protein L16
MFLVPQNSKYKKYHKSICKNSSNNFNLKDTISKSVKLISLSNGRISSKQLLSIRLLIKKNIKKFGIIVFKIFPHISITKKPSEIRMGKGKGSVNSWCAVLPLGVTICEIYFKNALEKRILNVLHRAQIRLSIKTKIFLIK